MPVKGDAGPGSALVLAAGCCKTELEVTGDGTELGSTELEVAAGGLAEPGSALAFAARVSAQLVSRGGAS